MKTEVFIERPLLDGTIRQSSKNGFLSANDLLMNGNKWRIVNSLNIFKYENWFNSSSTKEFLNELERQTGINPIKSKKGKTGERFLHPFAFIDLALRINPKLKIEIYSWLYDSLIKYRNDSGDSYKKMCGALWDNSSNKITFHKSIVKVADIIKKSCNVESWELATEEQLKTRDKIHENISLLCDVLRDNNQAIKIGISKAIN